MIEQDVVINLNYRRVMIIQAGSSQINVGVLVLSEMIRDLSCQSFRRRPFCRLRRIISGIRRVIGQPNSVSIGSPRAKVGKCMLGDLS